MRAALRALAIALVVAGIAAGLYILGSPAQARVDRLDQRRIQDLQQIEGMVKVYWGRQKHLPNALEELSAEPGMAINGTDPVTGAPYPYRVIDERTFELCAVFQGVSPRDGSSPNFWLHGAGRQCFRPAVKDD
jgi:hypothetical protein